MDTRYPEILWIRNTLDPMDTKYPGSYGYEIPWIRAPEAASVEGYVSKIKMKMLG
jgi:hypothetical protein